MGDRRRQAKPRNRRIGARLRAIRRQLTDLTLEEAAELLGWSASTLSRTENGIREITSEEVATIVTAYRLPAADRVKIIQDARAEHSAGWWDQPLPGVPTEMGVLAGYTAEANSLTDWSVMAVPGLLQTELYAMAMWKSGGVNQEDAQPQWEARKQRQTILGNVDYTAFIHEAALDVPFGGPGAHRAQLEHLAGARERGIAVRIMPRCLPYVVISYSWLYMTFPNSAPVVNVEITGGSVYLFDDQAQHYTNKIDLLDRLTLSSEKSSALLRSLVKAYR
ncbi:helix-turn-helix domain-containing protein [Actinophytocola sp. KF-1]